MKRETKNQVEKRMLELRRCFNLLDKWWYRPADEVSALLEDVIREARRAQDDIYRMENQGTIETLCG